VKKKRVIFIGGSSYSGSTMLDMMLSNNPNGFSLGEIHALFNPYRPHHFDPQCGCGDVKCDIWKQVKEAGEVDLYEKVFDLYPEIDYLIDSSKNPWWIRKQTKRLLAQGIEVYNIVIWKTPAYFAHSMLKRDRHTWKKSWINYYRQYFHLIPNSKSVLYEAFVNAPSSYLRQICTTCNIKFSVGMEEFWHKQHHTLFGNDSAKVHLVSENVENTSQNNNDKSEHREIYDKSKEVESLPTNIQTDIDNDKVLQSLMRYLNEVDIMSDTKSSERPCLDDVVTLTIFEKLSFKGVNYLKTVIGYFVGRHWRIF